MSASPALPSGPRRTPRWQQFSLRALLVLVALCCVGLLLWNISIEPYRRQHRFMEKVDKLKGTAQAEAVETWWQNFFREEFFVNVQMVGLDSATIDDAWLLNLRSVPQVWNLQLNGTQVGDAGMVHVAGLRELQWLGLGGTRLTDAGLAELRNLSKMEILILGHTGVTDAGLSHLEGMPDLATLNLSDTRVSDAGVARLVNLTKLRGLSLDNTDVTEASLVHLQQLPVLKHLSAAGTQIVPTALWHALPGLEDEKLSRNLADPTLVEFVETPLIDAIDYLEDYHRIEIVIDRRSLEQSGVTIDAPLTADLRGVTLDAALQQLLKPLGLKHVFGFGVLVITTADDQRARRLPRITLKQGEVLSREISAALHAPTVMDFENTPLADVLDYTSDYHKIRIRCEGSVHRKAQVTRTLRGIPLATALELIFDDLNVRGEIRGNTIVVLPFPVGENP